MNVVDGGVGRDVGGEYFAALPNPVSKTNSNWIIGPK
jgi:hypothetical protein